jgi:hypothetical protein
MAAGRAKLKSFNGMPPTRPGRPSYKAEPSWLGALSIEMTRKFENDWRPVYS